ncbi:MAG: glycoside hydrolase family 2 TIM barrel-domain containing protein [bacterium]
MKRIIAVIICMMYIGRVCAVPAEEDLCLYDLGTEEIVDYEKYGVFSGEGTPAYKYVIKDKEGLSKAAGLGVYPNTDGVYADPAFIKLHAEGKLEGNIWDFVYSDNKSANFYKWASAEKKDITSDKNISIPGVKQWFTAFALERAGCLAQAIKAYYAILVHFPKAMDWTFFNTPWYQSRAAVDKIEAMCRLNPELGIRFEGADVSIKGGYDDDITNDVFLVTPGRLIKVNPEQVVERKLNLSKLKRKQVKGKGKVRLVQYENSHWQLLVDNKPFMVKAVAYTPNTVGLTPNDGSLKVYEDWMFSDEDDNGKIDGPYDAYVDKNNNNEQDENEPSIGDFQLMKDMGVNVIRLYHHGANKKLLRDLYSKYGIRVIMCDYLGMYAIGSEAPYDIGTDYTLEEDKEAMMDSVREMVMEHKNEPYVLMWMLGNENNYGKPEHGLGCQAYYQKEEYYSFVNEAAAWIKSVDPNYPVAISNGDFLYLDTFSKLCPDVDIFGCNSYRGKDGFGVSLWKGVKDECDKPVIITEYGCPAYRKGKSREIAENDQAAYHEGCWKDIAYNSAGSGFGNSIGGVAFEWLDEWWKDGDVAGADKHAAVGNFKGPYPDGWLYEEWLGICSQGEGSDSPFLRRLRKVYYTYKKLWK